MTRKRILFVGESSYLASGFATYHNEVLSRLFDMDRYELSELACFGGYDDPRRYERPWNFIPNVPDPKSPSEEAEYNSNKLNEFGQWKFERVCLDIQPDVVVDVRDWFNCEFLSRSPFRRHYHLSLMPTVDSYPQQEQWLDTYLSADSIMTYTQWGMDVLMEQTGGRIRGRGVPTPGADTEIFSPVPDKEGYKRSMGLPPGALVVGTVMRNQPRKLYPELIGAFARFLKESPPHLRNNTYLYLHTSFPDQAGWDLPLLIKTAAIGHRTLLTYFCRSCKSSYPSFYTDAVSCCRNCGARAAVIVHPSEGLERTNLAKAYNLMDVFVQYANAEGLGMPQIEAASCGIPVMAIDYSAMSEVVRKVGGVPLKPLRLMRDYGVDAWRAVPDDDAFLGELTRLLSLPSPVRRAMGFRGRQAVCEHYTYDRAAKIWADLFDGIEPSRTWKEPARTHVPRLDIPDGLSDAMFVRWCISHVGGRPDLVNSYMASRLTRDLIWGVTGGGMGGLPYNDASVLGLGGEQNRKSFSRNDVVAQMLAMAEHHNRWEEQRGRL